MADDKYDPLGDGLIGKRDDAVYQYTGNKRQQVADLIYDRELTKALVQLDHLVKVKTEVLKNIAKEMSMVNDDIRDLLEAAQRIRNGDLTYAVCLLVDHDWVGTDCTRCGKDVS
jgi:hypothetical protein